MAKIRFSLSELIEILTYNKFLPTEIMRPKVKGQIIHFIIRTHLFVLPYIPATLRYLSFADNHALFELAIVSRHLDKVMKRIESLFPQKQPAYIKLEYPKFIVDFAQLLEENNIRGIRVKSVSFEQGQFTTEII